MLDASSDHVTLWRIKRMIEASQITMQSKECPRRPSESPQVSLQSEESLISKERAYISTPAMPTAGWEQSLGSMTGEKARQWLKSTVARTIHFTQLFSLSTRCILMATISTLKIYCEIRNNVGTLLRKVCLPHNTCSIKNSYHHISIVNSLS